MRALVLALTLSLFAVPARAQESGGSFGGSDWGDDDWGSSSSSDDWGSSSSSDDWGSSSSSDDWGSAPSAPSGPSPAELEAERRAAEAAAAAEAARRAEEERRRAEEARRLRLLSIPATERAHLLPFAPPPPPPTLRAPVTGPSAPVEVRSFIARSAVEPPVEPPRAARFDVLDRPMGLVCSMMVFLGLLPIALVVAFVRSPFRGAAPRAEAVPSGLARRVTLAFDWSERAALQAELRQLAQRFAGRDRAALHASATEVIRLLAARRGAIRYASWKLSRGEPRAWFQGEVTDLRARFTTERIRNQGGHVQQASGPAHVAREHEGQGLVVVSVLVAGRVPMSLPDVVRAEDVAQVLAGLVPPPGAMQALEVIWSPSEENDRMSSLELEHHYPELIRLGEGLGRTLCRHCRAPLPGELSRCPTCGAPRPG